MNNHIADKKVKDVFVSLRALDSYVANNEEGKNVIPTILEIYSKMIEQFPETYIITKEDRSRFYKELSKKIDKKIGSKIIL